MNIISLTDAVKTKNQKLIGKVVVNSEKLIRFAYDGDFNGIVSLIETGPVDISYKSRSSNWTIEDALEAGYSKNRKKIHSLIQQIKNGELKDLSKFEFEEKKPRNLQLWQKTLNSFKKKFSKMATGIELGQNEIADPLSSNFGMYVLGTPQEDWPMVNGELIPFFLQINISEMPYVPPSLIDFKLLVIFCSKDFSKVIVRTYKELSALVPLNGDLNKLSLTKRCTIKWSKPFKDYPGYDSNEATTFLESLDKEITENEEFINEFDRSFSSKVGGYPIGIQGEPFQTYQNKLDFVLQIESLHRINLDIMSSGAFYLARDCKNDLWHHEIQCY